MPQDGTASGTRQFKVVGTRPPRPDGIDKVTGKARFGADLYVPGMLWGLVLRSPHAHARIKRIDASRALALDGVKAVLTSADLPDHSNGDAGLRDALENVMARRKALYDGHPVAAVAATTPAIARQALRLITVDYEVLPHVTDVEAAMAPDAPILHDHIFTEGVEPKPTAPSNVAYRHQFGHGNIEKGFKAADVVIERTFRTEATHQGYIEPHACLGDLRADGSADIWCCTQGHYMVRTMCASLLGLDISRLRVTASEIGGGFGGKTVVFLEPLALALSRKAGRPIKMVMSREEVFRATGPTASSAMRVKIGITKDGRLTAGDAELKFQGGAFPGSLVDMGAMAAFACYALENVRVIGYDVVCNRPKLAPYRAPSAPIAAYAVESLIDEAAQRIGMDPLELRLKNAASEGTKSSYGPTYNRIGLMDTIEAARRHPHYKATLGKNQGRGVASGFWFNFGGNTSTSLSINADGTVAVAYGNPDIGGSRASMCMMVAEELGVPYESVRTIIADTASLGHNDVTDGSRVTFSAGIGVINSARNAIKVLCARAAAIWGIPPDAVTWENGAAKPAGPNAGKFKPLSLKEIATQFSSTGGPIAGHFEYNADGAGVSFGTHICDVEVDPDTGAVKVLRYTVVQDAGKAVHPSYVEGQMQGGAVQGIGWALNEEYWYGEDGRLQNPSFLDYRVPVASDVPMIDAVIVEVPNPGHPYGVRGVGETPIVPPLATVANAIAAATGVRLTHVPMSPPRVLQALVEGTMGKIHNVEAAKKGAEIRSA
ncbi:MAG TPA: xanthine dehydrogenase family protein molybdopterin-binding subunit [Hyphomicrobiaceae bacterium]|nr:xanthine dehydrogenase family protein molybdopterin-binding subunit [Hyphomicrobiaceae bacterium]